MKIPKPKSRKRRDAENTKKHEDRVAERLGGYRLPASGAGTFSKWQGAHSRFGMVRLGRGDQTVIRSKGKRVTRKGDLTVPGFHVEHKRTKARSIRLQKEWLAKVSEGASQEGKKPALVVTFEGASGRGAMRAATPYQDWVLLPLEVFERLINVDAE